MRIKRKSRIVIIVAAVSLLLLFEVDLSASTSNIVTANGKHVQSLDGRWEIIFDPENEGREGRWHMGHIFSAHAGRRDITVPSCWELIEKDYEGVAFYRRTFKVPMGWEGRFTGGRSRFRWAGKVR
jgi:beta-galactosidase/beta-glucuronidase